MLLLGLLFGSISTYVYRTVRTVTVKQDNKDQTGIIIDHMNNTLNKQ